jgi:hypothetical protein
MIGIDPRPFTLRELLLMGEGLGRSQWAQTSEIIAAIVRGYASYPKKITAGMFNPYSDENEPKPFSEAKKFFTGEVTIYAEQLS